jgi:hypothetical protein
MSIFIPAPWEPFALPNHDLATIFATIDRHAERLRRDHPDLIVPGTGCRGPHLNAGPFTVGSIVHMWHDVPQWFTGSCTVCGGHARGTEASGMLANGGITGWCLSCGLPLMRFVGGLPRVLGLLPDDAREQLFATVPSLDITVDGGMLITVPREEWQPVVPAREVSWEPLLEVLDTFD